MRGVIRPCRHQLGEELHGQWRAHLCGLCLSLRDYGGQATRALTGYDILLLSVLVEAQGPALATRTAGPCPLRGFAPATVVRSEEPAMALAAAGGLLAGATGLRDKLGDGQIRGLGRPLARAAARRLTLCGEGLAATTTLDPGPVLGAPGAAAAGEQHGATLDELLAPTGAAVASVFAHTAVVAGAEENRTSLAAAGEAFGRLVHLLDAIEDRRADQRAGKFNPLEATATSDDGAMRTARELAHRLGAALDQATWRDDRLVRALFGPVLEAAIRRVGGEGRRCRHHGAAGVGRLAAVLAAFHLSGLAAYRYRRSCCEDCCCELECCCCDLECCDCCCNN